MRSRKTNSTNALLGLLLSVVLLTPIAAPCHAQSYQDAKATREKLRVIREALMKNHVFPKESQVFVKNLADSNLMSSHMAIIVLAMASDMNLYNKKYILKILEKKILLARNKDEELSYVEYLSVLGFRKPTITNFLNKWESIRRGSKNSNFIDQEERDFTLEVINNKDVKTGTLAGRLFVKKFDLDLKSYRWAQSQIAMQIKTTQGPLRESWVLVQRVLAARCPKAASQK